LFNGANWVRIWLQETVRLHLKGITGFVACDHNMCWLRCVPLVTMHAVVDENTSKANNTALYSYGPSLFIYPLCPDNSSYNKSWPKNSNHAHMRTLTNTKPTSFHYKLWRKSFIDLDEQLSK
jgi:hypothetical protein